MIQERLLDTHCHIGAYQDPVAVLRAAEEAGVALVAVTEDPDEYRRLKMRLGRRDHVAVAIGLHPLHAATFAQNDMARFMRLLPDAEWIGEVGLDYSRAGAATAKTQQKVFDLVLAEAKRGQHTLTVHSRGAERDVIQKLAQAKVRAVLHWYSGPMYLVEEANRAGLYFSVNIAMTRSRKFPSLMGAVPRDRVLLETDGPYAKDRGNVAHPHQLTAVAVALGHAWGTELSDATETILANQRRFLSKD
ncbi:TatD family hydrolase [Arthrobacter sp. Soil762]|uniref:TatD family hydrolase n=1 Tax=Arthrobacter sp. Soil762 TaxID=1736401 RepID=UPI0006F99BC2|nr:TatD family hydrolase [Arthrobacter sp. Soil762]KRE72749.1 hydrolase TatD [Arthrobacter sp. Soil762]